jgi:DNA adenine methylase
MTPPPISRIGSKSNIAKDIVKYFPPHSVYIEPFVGTGCIFYNKKPCETEILNDLEKDMTDVLRDMRDVPTDVIQGYSFKDMTKERFNEYKKDRTDEPAERLYRNIVLSYCSFSSNRRTFGNDKREGRRETWIARKRVPFYKERLANATILNQDYRTVIKDHADNEDAFWYLDPPYDGFIGNWCYPDYPTVKDVYAHVKDIKGRFIISYNDTENVRTTFKDYTIIPFTRKLNFHTEKNDRKYNEVLIMNFTPL